MAMRVTLCHAPAGDGALQLRRLAESMSVTSDRDASNRAVLIYESREQTWQPSYGEGYDLSSSQNFPVYSHNWR